MPDSTKIFIAYSRKDEIFLNELRIHLTPIVRDKNITVWYDGEIRPGVVWDTEIKNHIQNADFILLLVSARSIASEYFYNEELKTALTRHGENEAKVVPIILSPCTWKATPIASLQVLPKDGKPITSWPNKDQAYANIVDSLWQMMTQQNEEKENEPSENKSTSFKVESNLIDTLYEIDHLKSQSLKRTDSFEVIARLLNNTILKFSDLLTEYQINLEDFKKFKKYKISGYHVIKFNGNLNSLAHVLDEKLAKKKQKTFLSVVISQKYEIRDLDRAILVFLNYVIIYGICVLNRLGQNNYVYKVTPKKYFPEVEKSVLKGLSKYVLHDHGDGRNVSEYDIQSSKDYVVSKLSLMYNADYVDLSYYIGETFSPEGDSESETLFLSIKNSSIEILSNNLRSFNQSIEDCY